MDANDENDRNWLKDSVSNFVPASRELFPSCHLVQKSLTVLAWNLVALCAVQIRGP
jgi:hypothetical protein